MAGFLRHFLLRERDQLSYILCSCVSQIDHDVRVDMGDLRIAVAMSFQSDVINKASSSDAFDLLEDRARAWMVLEPWVLTATPAEVLLHYAVHDCLVSGLELKRHRQCDIPLLVQNAGVVSELHVVLVDSPAIALLRQEFRRVKDVGYEHGLLTCWRGREKVEILPDRSANSARNADVVFETRPSVFDCLRY